MKYPLPPSAYSFNASAKTITFSGTVPAAIGNIMHVTNITRGVIYFQPQAGSSFTGTYASPVLTLAASTTGHSNGDELLIVYDDGLPTLPTGAATETKQDTLIGHVDGIEGILGTIDSDTGSIDGKLPALSNGGVPVVGPLTDTELRAAAVPVGDNSASLTVDGKAYHAAVTITRPANTTAYAAGDVVGDTGGSAILTLSNIGPSGGSVLVQSVELIFSDSAVISGMAAFRLHFYQASPTAIADNAAFDLVSGDRASYRGFVDISAPQDLGSSLFAQADYPGRLIKLASASTTLYAELETRGAYTPASASTIEVRVATLEAGL